MSKKTLIWTGAAWAMLTLYNYYYMNFFLLALEWIGLVLTLFVIVIIQVIKLLKERKYLSRLRIQYVAVFLVLFLLTLFQSLTNSFIEKCDWIVLYSKRTDIVKEVIDKKLNPNVSWNNWVCKLPFEFPVVSNGGNDIGISRNKDNGKTTVTFWVFRAFFDNPSTYFIYTDDPHEIEVINKKIKKHPNDNWKIQENWYRTEGDW